MFSSSSVRQIFIRSCNLFSINVGAVKFDSSFSKGGFPLGEIISSQNSI